MESTSILNNRYRLLSQIAAGGMAVVYKAQDMLLNRVVAVKVLRESFAIDPAFQARFQREAQAAANLDHPNIVTVYDVGRDGDRYYIVMEYVDGSDLKHLIRAEAPLPVARAVEIAIQVCVALGAAHRAGLVHCDVKPQNVLVANDGHIEVTDFGIARALSKASTSVTDTVWGTPHYISPEQASGEAPTPASDVYAVGVIMYEMLTARVPFEGDNHTQLALAHLRDEPPPIASLNPSVPPPIEEIVRKVMSKEPSQRYRNADHLATILIEYRNAAEQATGYVPVVRPPSTPTTARAPVHVPPATRPVVQDVLGFDWLGWLLGGLAAIALIGLIPMWLLVIRAYTTPAPQAQISPPAVLTEAPDLTTPATERSQSGDGISVPPVVGLTREEATARLVEAGFNVTLGNGRFDAEVPEGNVIEQIPAANVSLPSGSVVELELSRGPQVSTVVNVINYVLDPTIEEILKPFGWDVRVEEVYSQEPYRKVLNQFPPPGAQLAAGGPLTLTVSGGITLTLEVEFANQIHLDNVLLPADSLRRGESLAATYLWRATRTPDTPYIRFIHFVDPDGTIQAQTDSEPLPPTTSWARNQIYPDQFFLPVPAGAPPGEYRLYIGFYPVGRPTDRLPVVDPGKAEVDDDRVLVKTITVLP
jgi:serine/threonine-protein kinase